MIATEFLASAIMLSQVKEKVSSYTLVFSFVIRLRGKFLLKVLHNLGLTFYPIR